jgi:protein SCO1/2
MSIHYLKMIKKVGRFSVFALLLTIVLPLPSYAKNEHTSTDIGIDEKLGGYVPLDMGFYDEDGKVVRLGELVDRPTIISLVYYNCKKLCSTTLDGLSEVLGKIQSDAWKDYRVITISFDERDGPADASRKKRDYIKAIGKPFPPFPEEAWKFLTGDNESISKLTASMGFKFQKRGDDFLHPGTLIVLSSEGKIIRYLYGVRFLPFDLKMAVTEASAGRTGSAIRSALLFCFSYDPEGRRYVFNILKVGGAVTLFLALTFFIFLKDKK